MGDTRRTLAVEIPISSRDINLPIITQQRSPISLDRQYRDSPRGKIPANVNAAGVFVRLSRTRDRLTLAHARILDACTLPE